MKILSHTHIHIILSIQFSSIILRNTLDMVYSNTDFTFVPANSMRSVISGSPKTAISENTVYCTSGDPIIIKTTILLLLLDLAYYHNSMHTSIRCNYYAL